jgi:predicted metal-dependent enzyme (double-stranded beta helix superfamily)
MALRQSTGAELNEQRRLERLTKLCEELQAAVDRASDERRLLEEVKQVAQELLSDAESKPRRKKHRPMRTPLGN